MRQIGDLAMGILPPPPNDSAITIQPRPLSPPIGGRAGAPGLPTKLNSMLATGESPRQTDAELEASLTPLLGSAPIPEWVSLFTEWGYERGVAAYKIPICTPQQRGMAWEVVKMAMQPMSLAECAGLLGELKLLTTRRNESEDDVVAQVGLYARKLEAFPADVAREVLKTQASISQWWPSWHELQVRLERGSRRREMLMTALRSQS